MSSYQAIDQEPWTNKYGQGIIRLGFPELGCPAPFGYRCTCVRTSPLMEPLEPWEPQEPRVPGPGGPKGTRAC